MAPDVPAARGRSGSWRGGVAALVAGGLALFAYRHVLLPQSRAAWLSLVDAWFFDAQRVDLVAPLLVGGWLLYRRRRRLRERRGPAALPAAAASGLAAAGLLAWSRYSGAPEPAALALPLGFLAWMLAWGGRRAARVAALPIGLLLFALPPPAPLYNALIWQLQLWTSVCVSGVLRALGLQPQTLGDLILVGAQTFHVIETCAGLRIVQLLTLLAFALADVLGLRGARALCLVAAAPLVGFGMNGLRALSIAVAPGTGEQVHHLGQGLATFSAACAVQYVLGLALRGRPASASEPALPPGSTERRAWMPGLILAAGLAGVSLVAPTRDPAPAPPLALTSRLGGPPPRWEWSEQPRELLFLGATRYADSLRRIYWPEGAGVESGVELFAGLGGDGVRRGFPFGPKTALPGPGWVAERESAAASPIPGATLRVRVVRQGERRLRVHEFRSGERGLWLESLHWLAGLDQFGAPTRRAVVRLATRLDDGDGHDGDESAAQRLDALFEALREPLAGILSGAEPSQRRADFGPSAASSSASSPCLRRGTDARVPPLRGPVPPARSPARRSSRTRRAPLRRRRSAPCARRAGARDPAPRGTCRRRFRRRRLPASLSQCSPGSAEVDRAAAHRSRLRSAGSGPAPRTPGRTCRSARDASRRSRAPPGSA